MGGRYTGGGRRAERGGFPTEMAAVKRPRRYWEPMKLALVRDVDRAFGVYDGTTLKFDRLNCYAYENGIAWPRTETGRLQTDKKTWEQVAQTYPQLAPLATLHYTLNDLKLEQ